MLNILQKLDGFDDTTLTIVGSSEDVLYRRELFKEIRLLGLEKVIKFEGCVKHESLPYFYHSHHFLIFPSGYRESKYTIEGCPSVILEGMASGILVIAGKAKGVNESILGKDTCKILKDNNTNTIVKAITNLVQNEKLRNVMINNSRLLVKKQFNLVLYIERINTILKELVSKQKHSK